MSTTDRRVEELLDRWLASVELHLRYLKLDDAAYARAEAWPKHQRPNALVVNLARTRLLELKAHLSERRDAGDARFAESLELMSFLTSLLGSEHIERFIPLATGKPPDTSASGTVEQPRLRASSKPAAHRSSAAPAKAAVAPSDEKPRVAAQPPKRSARAETVSGSRPAPHAAAAPPPAPDAMSKLVIADAVRMLEWGREWPALAGLIARLADRPSEPEAWKILRAYRSQIMAKARRPAG